MMPNSPDSIGWMILAGKGQLGARCTCDESEQDDH